MGWKYRSLDYCLLEAGFLVITKVAHTVGILFSHGYGNAMILTKMDCVTFFTIFSQTHSVTLNVGLEGLLCSFVHLFADVSVEASE
jgi:hypothetical protein